MRTLDHFIHHFFPHKHNNHKAHALQAPVLFLYLLFFVIFQFASPFLLKMKGDVLGYATNIEEDNLLIITNQKRAEKGLKPLTKNEQLASAAAAKAKYMFTNNFWAHNAPDGTTPWKFINDAKYDYIYAGENLARDFENSEDVVVAWMDSPSHRANILQEKYEDIGFAVVNGVLNGEETTLVVQMFGTLVSPNVLPETSTAPQVKEAQPENNLDISVNMNQEKNLSITKFIFTKEFSLMFIGFLLLLLIIDGFIIWKNKIIRISSYNLAHFMLLASLFLVVTFLKTGSVL